MDSSPAQHRGKAVPLRALIVDDCKYTRQLVRLILVNNLSVGEVTEADGAEHALMQLRGVHRDRFPHVVILDCEMPGMRGPQLATAIRTGRDLLNPSVPIVMRARMPPRSARRAMPASTNMSSSRWSACGFWTASIALCTASRASSARPAIADPTGGGA